jgi:poly-gamma-glutamate capsule biosynthesis protein CapA/YwtB (metallophosphatase superfamily)
MTKEDLTDMIPEAEEEQIAAEIRTAREQGAQAVVVLLNWGKTGKSPDTNQVSLAAKIAEAGADLIIGAGSRQLQGAEYLAGPEGRQVLCCWSLGSLITGDRGNVRRIAGYLLHVTFSRDEDRARLQKAEYTPVYAWKFKQDGSFFYRCVAANQPAPDGMDNEQQKYMANALQIAETALAGSPVLQRTGKGGD